MKRIAIIGSGISGLGAAYALKDTADITVFEARDRLGGHSCTQEVDYDGTQLAVDIGFIVYNALNYPNLIGFFNALGVETQASDMSFSVSDPNGWEWASSARGIFAQKRNLFSLRFHKFWRTILRFNDVARAELAAGDINDATLGAYLERHGYSDDFRQNYILPMGAAIWSTPEDRLLDYPAKSFFQFFDNHHLMHKERPKWRTVSGGSQHYVERVGDLLSGRVRTGDGVAHVLPFGDRVRIITKSGEQHVFDDVILATHSDQSLDILDERYEAQRFALRSARYRPNHVYLHRDPSLMPKRKAAWASWNVLKQDGEDICLTYWMNRLQSIDEATPLFVTLNPARPPQPHLTFYETEFDHPQFDAAAEAAVREVKRMQGQKGIWLAGAWMGRGFHEDGLKSGLSCGLSLGGQVPWQVQGVDISVRSDNHVDELTAARATR